MRNFKFLIFVAGLFSIFWLSSCNKDSPIIDEHLDIVERRSTTVRDFSAFENAFNAQKTAMPRDSMSILNPLRFNLNMESATYTNFLVFQL
ncbi:MAG: hypothetical protein IPO92_16790 [Saprospiraceae bacterium]|nr:hypothetical protein [Saprospiraceae bacterium]